jgi:3-dehydroquinate synthetase|eukprot:COSAG06_NODE_2849_length_6180_cov_65.395823_6_plen_110_part_00
MLTCGYIAEKTGLMTPEERQRHDAIIELMDLKLPVPRPSIESVMGKLMRDSKRGIVMEEEDEVSEVLLTAIGTPLESKSMLHVVKAELVREWLESVGFVSEGVAGGSEG